MSRSARKVLYRPVEPYRRRPWGSETARGLRYSAACVRVAERGGHRPRPAVVRRETVLRTAVRALGDDPMVRVWVRHRERQARQVTRRALRAARWVPDEVDVLPTRHRRGVVTML
ncbi:hypothetical protein Aglo01_33810 [Actinokineospora globicatena]|nr:hypothetical protein Aglo01_33810 [Actinokineospora globicatena]GLW86688.1 hypothetical protein Aglo02_43270 [Actinokineospora globicatena]